MKRIPKKLTDLLGKIYSLSTNSVKLVVITGGHLQPHHEESMTKNEDALRDANRF